MRFVAPQPVEGWLIVIVAGIALAVDVVTAVLTYALSKKSMNIRAAFLHNVADALGSIGVIVAGTLIILSRLAGGRSDRHADDRGLHPVAGLHRDRRRDPPHARHPARRNSSAPGNFRRRTKSGPGHPVHQDRLSGVALRRHRDINSTEAGRPSLAVMPKIARCKRKEGRYLCIRIPR
jgi:Cation efflux family